jgi:membrane protease YdiL (CAAX protease family)
MIGIVIELLLSWVILKYVSGKNLLALGFYPERKQIKTFIIGLVWPLLFLTGLYLTIGYTTHNPYKVNPSYTLNDFFTASAYVFRAVIFEELIFRGALFYLLIQYLGTKKAMLISAASFGIYHWFSWGIIGQPVQMAIVFAMTGITGYLFALSFVKTRSIYLPILLHLSYNFANMVVFSKDKAIGLQLLVKSFPKDPFVPAAFVSIPLLLLHFVGFYVICYLWLRWLPTKGADNQANSNIKDT